MNAPNAVAANRKGRISHDGNSGTVGEGDKVGVGEVVEAGVGIGVDAGIAGASELRLFRNGT